MSLIFKRTAIFQWLLAALSLAPLILYAYLGQFSHLIADDYCYFASGQARGAWGGMLNNYNRVSSGYAGDFLVQALAPLGDLAPRMAPALMIALWMVGLSGLVFQVLTYLKINDSRRALAVAISAFIVAASIHAFYSPQSFYWLEAAISYTLMPVLLAIYMALALWLRSRLFVWGIIAGAALCFISAGMSEMSLVFQLAFLTFCLLMIVMLAQPSARRSYMLVFGAGWLGTLGSLVIQLSSPGAARRAGDLGTRMDQPYWIETLASETWHRIKDYIQEPQVFLGFVILMGVGLLVMLVKYQPQPASKTSKPAKVALPSLWLGLIFQLLWIPLLWQRENGGQMAVILNAAFILSFLVLLWQRKRINAQLQKHDRGRLTVYSVIVLMFIVAVLFAITQQNAFYQETSHYLFMSFMVLGGMIIWQMSSLISTAAARRFGLLALLSYAVAVVCIVAMTTVALFGRGFVPPRILAPGAWMLALSGLIWGAYLGYLIKNHPPRSQARVWIGLFKLISLAAVLIIAGHIALNQAALIPDFQLYAREWDARHQDIIAQRDRGQTTIEVAPLTFELVEYIGLDKTLADFPTNGCAARYYGVDSIAVVDS